MATVLTIDGTAVNVNRYNIRLLMNLRFGHYSTLTIQRRGGPLPGLPDPWLGKTVSLSIGGTTYFQGDVASMTPQWTNVGWTPTYQVRDLTARIDRTPITDSNTQTDTASFNLSPEDPRSIPGRQGRNVGQIVTDLLTGLQNATALNAKGVGGYTSLSPVTLPSVTVSDLATMTIIPPSGVYIIGERIWTAIVAFLRYWAPNHLPWIDMSTGAFRFFDKRTFTNHTLTMGTNPISPTPLTRNVGDCFQRVVVRGQPVAEPKLLSIKNGGLAEDFAWDSFTNAQAKANWSPLIAQRDSLAKDEGTCTCTDTLNVVVTSSITTRTWASNYWDQTSTGAHGVIQLNHPTGTDINQYVTRRIVSNAALTAGSTANCVLDLALPATNYTTYQIYGVTSGSGFVWKKYLVTNTLIGNAMAREFTYPQPFVGANGDVAVMTSYPMGSVCYSASGNPPYQEWPVGLTLDPSSSHIYFLQPTFTVCGNHTPSDVRVLVPVNIGNLTAVYPPDTSGSPPTPNYGGTSHTVDGLSETLFLTVGQWRDPINQTAMNAFAQEVYDSVKDAVVEGDVTYHGLYTTALTPGQALSITGTGYSTGWEDLALPILDVELRWNSGVATQFTTTMGCSNRRASLTSSAFLRPSPSIAGQQISDRFVLGLGRLTRDPVTGARIATGPGQMAAGVGGMAESGLEPLSAIDAGLGPISSIAGVDDSGVFVPGWATAGPGANRDRGFVSAGPDENKARMGTYWGKPDQTASQRIREEQQKRVEDRAMRERMRKNLQKQRAEVRDLIKDAEKVDKEIAKEPGRGFVDVPPVPESERDQLPVDEFTLLPEE